MIFNDFFRALGQMADPRFRRVFFKGLGLTLLLLFSLSWGLSWLVGFASSGPVVLPGYGEISWLGDLAGWGSFLVFLVLSVFVMPAVAVSFIGLFLDQIASAVEDRHYPHLPSARPVKFYESARDAVNFLGVIIAANLVAVVLYVMFPPVAPFLFFALNGYLLGREYFQLVAMRRLGRQGAKAAWKRHKGAVWGAGVLMALPLTVPLLNLAIPILGVATFTHLFHRLERL
ncbi:EI24 domain-containing protein [Candidatus Halocynthiibacter alkanivorans]|uniref:EI24 domain-containing protein n=1 Tax=Candidatus Halocynthiibacter alkanivorans TaxID=2267619 RepID=UPI000DF152E5|nr:EI24 domain-containing protein [Candidatus Halocynthiibacter alkanivorans]